MSLEQPVRIGYLGPPGTFSEQAAWQRSLAWAQVELVPLPSLDAVVAALRAGSLDEAVLPAENAGEGTVGITLDLLAYEAEGLGIYAEVVLPVHHALVAPHGVEMKHIVKVLSHPQALGQCRRWLARYLPGVPLEETASTGEATLRVSRSGGRPWAAVAAPRAAALQGLDILAADIADLEGNATRFLVLGAGQGASDGGKASLVAALADQPGALYGLLGEFAQRGINLCRIESRPARTKLGEYLFLIDIDGGLGSPAVGEALARARTRCSFLRVLGFYNVYGPPKGAGDVSSGSSGRETLLVPT